MAKIMLDCELKNLTDNDVLVYNARKQVFINKKKAVYLGETTKEIDNLKKQIKCLKTQINDLQDKFNSLLNILKEKL